MPKKLARLFCYMEEIVSNEAGLEANKMKWGSQ